MLSQWKYAVFGHIYKKIYFPPIAFQINKITFAPLLDEIRFVLGWENNELLTIDKKLNGYIKLQNSIC